MTAPLVGRFAPSPTGRMHAGNIFAALLAWLIVRASGGEMVLRIEDLDPERSKPHFADAVQRDLEALGLTWDRGPFWQHDRTEAYEAAFETIVDACGAYPCFCTRADLAVASAPHLGDKHVYRGTCRSLSAEEVRERRGAGEVPAIRLRVPHERIAFDDIICGSYGQMLDEECGDFIVRRKDGAFAYQLAVGVDDAAQGVTSVTRGVDLLSSTPQQVFLQRALGLPEPVYAHLPLLVSEGGRRLSKRDGDASLDGMLARFGHPAGIIGHIAWIAGLQGEDAPATPEQLLEGFDISALPTLYAGRISIPWR